MLGLAIRVNLLTFGRVQASLTLILLACSLHPGSHRLSCLSFEGISKCIVTAVATLKSQLLGGESMMSSHSLTIESDKVMDAQIIDIGIVCQAPDWRNTG